MRILTIQNDESKVHETFVEMFQYLSENDMIITDLTDEKISVTKTTDQTSDEIEVFLLNNKGLKEGAVGDISKYRDEIRNSVKSLQKQKLITSEILEKLSLQFAFLK